MIRLIKIDDIPACAKILKEAYSREPYLEEFADNNAEKYLLAKYASCGDSSFVIEENGEVIAFILLSISFWGRGKQAIIEEIVVDPKFQGKGFGKQLMEYSIEYFNSLGVTSIMLWVKNNERLLNFYKKNNFFIADDFVVMFRN